MCPGGVYAQRDLQPLRVVCDGGLRVRRKGSAVVADDAENHGDVCGAGVAGCEDEIGRVDVFSVLDYVARDCGEGYKFQRVDLFEAGDLGGELRLVAACAGEDLRACDCVGLVYLWDVSLGICWRECGRLTV